MAKESYTDLHELHYIQIHQARHSKSGGAGSSAQKYHLSEVVFSQGNCVVSCEEGGQSESVTQSGSPNFAAKIFPVCWYWYM
jgi:hypothetical protein